MELSGAGRRQRLNSRGFDMAAVIECKARPVRARNASTVRERQVGRLGGDRFNMPQGWRSSTFAIPLVEKTSVRVPWIIAWNDERLEEKGPTTGALSCDWNFGLIDTGNTGATR